MDNDSTGNLIQGASRLAVALIFGATALAAQAAPVTTQGTWWGSDGTDGTLQARDIDGNAVALDSTVAVFFYDTALDITWLGDWNDNNGTMNWTSALAWAAALDINGYTGWRLPTTPQPDPSCASQIDAGAAFPLQGAGLNCTGSEMGHMYYETLGNLAENVIGGGLTNTAYFSNMQSDFYWSGTEYAPNPSNAWGFHTGFGGQGFGGKFSALYAVAVRPGDVLAAQAVPEPGTLGLLLAALGVGAVVRRRRAH